MTNKFTICKGDNEKLTITVYDSKDIDTRAVVPLTGAKIWFSVKKYYIDEEYQFQRKNADAGGSIAEIKMTDPANGRFEIYIVPANTEEMSADNYIYDIQIELSPYGKKTVVKSTLILEDDVTKE